MKINELKNFIKKVINETSEFDSIIKGLETIDISRLEIGDAEENEDKKINLAIAKFIGKNKAMYADEDSDISDLIIGLTPKSKKTITYKNENGYETWIFLKKYLTKDGRYQIVEREVEQGYNTMDYFITKREKEN